MGVVGQADGDVGVGKMSCRDPTTLIRVNSDLLVPSHYNKLVEIIAWKP